MCVALNTVQGSTIVTVAPAWKYSGERTKKLLASLQNGGRVWHVASPQMEASIPHVSLQEFHLLGLSVS